MWIFILSIGLIIFLSHLFTTLFEKTRIPDVLLLMLIGIGIGPLAGWISPLHFGTFGNVLTTVALIVILFEGGTSLRLSEMKKAALPMSVLTVLTFLLTAGICFAVAYWLIGMEIIPAMLCGTIMGGTSSAVVIPMIRSLKVKEPVYSVLMIESALTDVLCIVCTFVLIDAGTGYESIGTGSVVWSLTSTLIFAALIGIAGGIGWMLLLKWVRAYPNTMFTTLAFVFILFGLAEMLGLSGAITALTFGITLGNLPEGKKLKSGRELVFNRINEQEKNFFSESVFLLKTFFFLYLGISIQFESWQLYLMGGLIVLLVFVMRVPITWLAFSKKRDRQSVRIASVMVPKGLAAAVLAGMPLTAGVPGSGDIQGLVFAVVLISIIVSALLTPFVNSLFPYRQMFASYQKDGEENTMPSQAGQQAAEIREEL